MEIEQIAPKLIDDHAIYFLDSALKKSHQTRVKYHRILFNFWLVFLFICVFGGFMYYRYTYKPSQTEVNYKLIKDQEYVLSKIRFFQEQNQRMRESERLAEGSEITGLPVVHPSQTDELFY